MTSRSGWRFWGPFLTFVVLLTAGGNALAQQCPAVPGKLVEKSKVCSNENGQCTLGGKNGLCTTDYDGGVGVGCSCKVAGHSSTELAVLSGLLLVLGGYEALRRRRGWTSIVL